MIVLVSLLKLALYLVTFLKTLGGIPLPRASYPPRSWRLIPESFLHDLLLVGGEEFHGLLKFFSPKVLDFGLVF